MKLKTFQHLHFPEEKYKKAERIDGEAMRLYETVDGNRYPSITSILGCQPKPELEAWKARVGEVEAARVSKEATVRGSRIHDMCEAYLKNQFNPKEYNPFHLDEWMGIKNHLDKHVDNVFSTELMLYSDRLRAAGTADLIAEYNGVLSLLDFKTSKRIKYKSDIKDYFLQCAAYSCMIYEMFGIKLNNIVILMIVDGGTILTFEEKAEDYIKDFFAVRKLFKEIHNI